MKITVLAVGKMRGADAELCGEYVKRLGNIVAVKEIGAAKYLAAAAAQKAEADSLLASMPAKAFAVLCDERGKDLSSRELADKLALWQEHAAGLTFIIGGADGVTDAVKARADFVLSFGRKTWPHRLARVMLLEQIYRAQQINAGHPYHRD